MEQVQPGMEMSRPGPLVPLAKWILETLQSCATAIGNASCSQLISSIARDSNSSASKFISDITKALGSRDLVIASDGGDDVVEFHQAVEMLCFCVFEHFSERFPDVYKFEDIADLPLIADDFSLSFLIARSILTVPDVLKVKMEVHQV